MENFNLFSITGGSPSCSVCNFEGSFSSLQEALLQEEVILSEMAERSEQFPDNWGYCVITSGEVEYNENNGYLIPVSRWDDIRKGAVSL